MSTVVVIQSGPQGPQGATGATGATGPAGSSAAGTCTLEQFGAVGDGVTNDNAAWQAAMAAVAGGTYHTLILGAKTYLVQNFTWNGGAGNGGSIIGQGHKSVLKYSGATVGLTGLLLLQNLDTVVLKDFTILGDGVSSQRGILAGTAASDAPQNLTLEGVRFKSLLLSGIHTTNAPVATSQVCSMTNCRADSCGIGIVVGAQMILTSVDVSGCTTGLDITAGNITATGCLVSENTTAILIEPSGNDGHGTVTGVTVNHNNTYGFDIQGIANGMTFSGCHFYAESNRITGNTGIVEFVGCSIEPINLTFDNCLVRFIACRLNTAVFIAASYLNNPQVEYVKCLDLAGNVSSIVASKVQASLTPANGANTLTKMQSVAEVLNLVAGATLGFTLTSTLTPAGAQGRQQLIKNNTSQTCTFQWSTGASITILTGKSAIVGSDGTNAIILLQGA